MVEEQKERWGGVQEWGAKFCVSLCVCVYVYVYIHVCMCVLRGNKLSCLEKKNVQNANSETW